MNKKISFLKYEAIMLAWNGAFQRNKTYEENASDTDKQEFKEKLLKILSEDIWPQYQKQVDETNHLQNIDFLRVKASSFGNQILKYGNLKYGTAQKLLNLSLKYFWCLDLIPIPPHCPVDGIIIKNLNIKIDHTWTHRKFEVEHYNKVIEQIRKKAITDGLSIAECELKYFRRS